MVAQGTPLLPPDVAIFFDWTSLCQKDPVLFDDMETPNAQPTEEARNAFLEDLRVGRKYFGGKAYQKSRSGPAQACFNSALCRMEVWYASSLTTVLLMTAQRAESSTLAYQLRGWTNFERACAMLAKAGVSRGFWPTLIDASRTDSTCKRFAPLTPDLMSALLADKHFTNGADREFVLQLYVRTANVVIGSAEELRFDGLGWDDAQLAVLCEWLPQCTSIRELALYRNKLTDEGLKTLVKAMEMNCVLQKLEALYLWGNMITASGSAVLAHALEAGALPSLKKLTLDDVALQCVAWDRLKGKRPHLEVA